MRSHRWTIRSVAAAVAVALGATVVATAAPAGAAPAATSVRVAAAETAPTGDIVETATSAGQFTTLLAAAQAAGLMDALKSSGPLTVFAPTDQAFSNLLNFLGLKPEQLLAHPPLVAAILKYHVVSGKVLSTDITGSVTAPTLLDGTTVTAKKTASGVKVNGAKVVSADVLATNGVIHVIDKVLLPVLPQKDIVDTAKGAGAFSTLLAAAQAAGLVDALEGDGPLTVFAPTDAAFARTLRTLGITAEQLLADPARLATILKHHVVSGWITSNQLGRRTVVTTLAGDQLVVRKVRVFEGRGIHRRLVTKVTVDGVRVFLPDVKATNGVIHVIGGVLLP